MALLSSGDLKAHRVVKGLCAIEIGAAAVSNPAATYIQLGASMKSVGIVNGAVEISPNQQIHTITASNMSGPHAAFDSGVTWQVTFNLQEFDLWNLALALSYTENDVTSSTALLIGDAPSASVSGVGYMSLLVKHYTVPDSNMSIGAQYVSQFEFFKVKFNFNGSISFQKDSPPVLPMMAHCLHNEMDIVGQYKTDLTITKRGYEGT